MSPDPIPFCTLVARANAELKRCRALMLARNYDLVANIRASRALLGEAAEVLARADRVLQRQRAD
jgi:hypothetical protein